MSSTSSPSKSISRSRVIFGFGGLLALTTVILGAGCGAGGRKDGGGKFEVRVETLPAMTVVALNRIGPYSGVGAATQELMAWIKLHNVAPAGPPICFYYDDPAAVSPESCNWAVCVPVQGDVQPDTTLNITVNNLAPMMVAFTMHTGGYERIQSTYDKLLDWIDENGFEVTGPAVEVYLSGENVPVESLKSKLGFTVRMVEEIEGEEMEEEEEVESAGDSG